MKLFILFAYLLILLVIGWFTIKKTKTVDDFLIGGRSIGPFMSAFSYGTTYFSAVIFIGYAGNIGWGFGLSDLWIVVGNALVGSFLAWKVLAKRTRNMTARLNAITMPAFLSKRYDSPKMRIFAALVIFVFLVPYSSSVYSGLSYFFESVFGISYVVALFIMAGVTALYLIMGGYFAVTWTDLFQGVLMLIGAGALVYFVVVSPEVGGFSQIVPKLNAINPKLTSPLGPNVLTLASLVFLTSVGTWGLPQMTQKFYAVKNEQVIKIATWVTGIFALWIAFGAYFTGSLSHLFFPNLDALGGNVDRIIPTMVSGALPEYVAVVVLLLVFSASMSTLASLVLVSSSSVAVDFMEAVRPQTKKTTTMLMMRILCVLFIALSVYLALRPNVIVTLMAFSWGALAGAFLGPYVLGLYFKGITKAGAWAGMITGVTFTTVTYFIFPTKTPLCGSIAMILSLVVVPAVSAFTKKLSEEHLAVVFEDNDKAKAGVASFEKVLDYK